MKLSVWAKQQGISYRTAWRWFKAGCLPVPSKQLPSGTIIVNEPDQKNSNSVAIYARVSSHDQKNDLDRQVARLVVHANQKGFY